MSELTDPDLVDRRLTELEIRSEEAAESSRRLEEFVAAYEARIDRLERTLKALQERLQDDAPEMPPPEEDLPPHY